MVLLLEHAGLFVPGLGNTGMIELDESVVLPQDLEYARCTCLDRARIALEQTGQHHCAMYCGQLQDEITAACEDIGGFTPHCPIGLVSYLHGFWLGVIDAP